MTIDYDLVMAGQMVAAGFSYHLRGERVDCKKSGKWDALALYAADGREWLIIEDGILIPLCARGRGVLTVDDLEVIGLTENLTEPG